VGRAERAADRDQRGEFWSLELRCRTDEAITLVDHANTAHGMADTLTLGTTTARPSPAAASRRPSPNSASATPAAFIESWFGKLKQRLVRCTEFETLDDARSAIGGYIDGYHQRPHSGLRYRTPAQVRQPGTMDNDY
jgi:putative transposase